MKRAMRDLAILLLLAWAPGVVIVASSPARAGDGSSSSIWTVDEATVRVRLMIPADAARKLVAANAPTPELATVAATVSQSVGVTTPSGDCEAIDQGEGVGQIYTLTVTPGIDRFEMVFACPQANALTLRDDFLFDRDHNHVDYAQIRIGAGRPVLDAFTPDRRRIALPAPPVQPRGADAFSFGRMAAIRTASSIAALHILFGSVLLSRRWIDLAWLAASLALGYLISIGLGLSGVVVLDQGLAGATLGLLAVALGLGAVLAAGKDRFASRGGRMAAWASVVLVGLTLVVVAALKSPLTGLATFGIAIFGLASVRASQIEPRLGGLAFAPAAAFAFLDGLGPASDLTPLHPAVTQMAPILTGHDLGEWLAATALAGVIMGLIWLAGLRLRPWKAVGSECAGAALIGVGLFWFIAGAFSAANA